MTWLYFQRLIEEIICNLIFTHVRPKRLKFLNKLADIMLDRETVMGVLKLSNFACDFCNFPAFSEIDEICVWKEVEVALFNVQDIRQVHS